MYQHHIQLKVADILSNNQATAWYLTVKEFGPDDILFSYTHNGNEVSMEYGMCEDCELSHTYVVPLKRDLSATETAFILEAWNHVFTEDFDIEISNTYDMVSDYDSEINIDEDVKSQASMDINKWDHNRWVENSIMEGWRWGTHYNSKEKTHPALRPWDDLPESHRRIRHIDDVEIFEWLSKNRII